jgi:hypothetical protein
MTKKGIAGCTVNFRGLEETPEWGERAGGFAEWGESLESLAIEFGKEV